MPSPMTSAIFPSLGGNAIPAGNTGFGTIVLCLSSLPVIIITGKPSEKSESFYLERGAVGFFRSLYPHNAQDELDGFLERLKEIQDALGTLNDFVAHEKLASTSALQAPAKNRRARAFTAGLLVGEEREASRDLIDIAQSKLRHLRPTEASCA